MKSNKNIREKHLLMNLKNLIINLSYIEILCYCFSIILIVINRSSIISNFYIFLLLLIAN